MDRAVIAAISNIGLIIGQVSTDFGCKLVVSKSSDQIDTAFGLSCGWKVGERGYRSQPFRLNFNY